MRSLGIWCLDPVSISLLKPLLGVIGVILLKP